MKYITILMQNEARLLPVFFTGSLHVPAVAAADLAACPRAAPAPETGNY